VSEQHFLYRLWDSARRLLYVGVTNSPRDRIKEHKAEKPWWYMVDDVTTETFSTREDALRAERVALATESPIFNFKHSEHWAKRPAVFRALSIPADPWFLALVAAHDLGENIHAVITAALNEYVARHKSLLENEVKQSA
jgi:hypothetical protein